MEPIPERTESLVRGRAEMLLASIEQPIREAGLSMRDAVIPTAILLLIRWMESDEAEKAAFAALEGKPFSSSIPEDLHWEVISSLRGSSLRHHLQELLLPDAVKLLEGEAREKYLRDVLLPKVTRVKSGPYLQYMRHMVLVWPSLIDLPSMARDALVNIVGTLPLDRVDERHVGEQLLATMIRDGATDRSAFHVPQKAIDLMLEIAQPQRGERIYDPCFGAGGLLAGAATRLRLEAERLPTASREEKKGGGIFGVEHYARYFFVGMVRVLLAGAERPQLTLSDALTNPRPLNPPREGFDCILACPPWRAIVQRAVRTNYDILTSSSEGLFVQHILAHLRPGGRAVIALPHSFLFSRKEELRIRKLLLEEFRVEGVIGLPPNIFKPYTNMLSSLLVVRKEAPSERVKFLLCEEFGEDTLAAVDVNEFESPKSLANKFLHGTTPSEHLWYISKKALAQRGYDLSPRKTGQEDLEKLLEEISSADDAVEIRSLGRVLDVLPGVSYRRDQVLDMSRPLGGDVIAQQFDEAIRRLPPEKRKEVLEGGHLPMLVRVGDLGAKGVTRPKLAIISAELVSKWRGGEIRASDVLVSVSGTIGKVVIATDAENGFIPSRGVMTLRPLSSGVVNPRYVAAILRSSHYQEWLLGHSAGSTIQSLSARTLKDAPLPIPTRQAQQRVVSNCDETGADALDELLRVLTTSERDAIAEWLESRSSSLRSISADTRLPPDEALRELEELERELRALRNEVAHSQRASPPLRDWLFRAWESMSQIGGVADVTDGAFRYAVLREARTALSSAAAQVASDSPGRKRIELLTERAHQHIDLVINSLLSNVRLSAALDRSAVSAGLPEAVNVTLVNDSSLALRDFRCRAAPFEAAIGVKYFPARESTELPLSLPASEAQHVDFELHWTARRLDGRLVEGRIPLRVAVEHAASMRLSRPRDDLGINPYITGTPVDRPNMLFGREGIIQEIKRRLANAEHNHVILLEGNRRAGKTSILWQLERDAELPEWVVVRCDFQGAAGPPEGNLPGIPTENVFAHLASTIAEAGLKHGFRFWPPGQPTVDPSKPFRLEFNRAFRRTLSETPAFELFTAFLESVLAAIRPKRLLLMLDEFDRIQEGIDSGLTSPQLPQNLRFVLQNYRHVSAILTGSRRMTQLRSDYWSVLFGLGSQIRVTSIERAEAEKLVTSPVEGRLVFPPAAVARIVKLCACQPFLIQHLCSKLFNICGASDRRAVTVDMVDDAAMDLVQGMEHFEAYWAFAGDERARFILCLVHRLSQGDDPLPVTLPRLEDELESFGIQLTREELLGDELKKLVELELLHMEREGQYRLAVPLLALWISRNKDCEDQRERAVIESEQRSRT